MTSTLRSGLTISIVNYNTWDDTIRCIRSILAPGLETPYEILVFDNGSTPCPTIEPDPRLTIHSAGRNLGFGGGHNVNLARSQYNCFLILNPDVVANHPAIHGLLTDIQSEDISAVAPLLMNNDGSIQQSTRRLPNIRTELARVFGLDRRPNSKSSTLVTYRRSNGLQQASQPAGAALMSRTTLLRSIGGFDGRFPMYFEDVDLCRSLSKLGRIVVDTDISMFHRGEGTAKLYRAASVFWIETSRRRYYQKWSQGMELAILNGLCLVSVLSHGLACSCLSIRHSSKSSRNELRAKAQGYWAAFVSRFFGSEVFWKERFLK